ncbi:hypothetical protein ANTRET_LOCUS10782 [Anthophora retusa]
MSTVCQRFKKATEVSDVLPEKQKPIDCPNLRVCREDKDKKQHHLKEEITRSRVEHEDGSANAQIWILPLMRRVQIVQGIICHP